MITSNPQSAPDANFSASLKAFSRDFSERKINDFIFSFHPNKPLTHAPTFERCSVGEIIEIWRRPLIQMYCFRFQKKMSADNELRYKSSSMVADMLIGLEDAYNSREFSDVSLELGCRSFSCHRVILAAASPFFKAMFTSDMCEKGQSDVRISENFNPDIFDEVLAFIYSSTISISCYNVETLLHISTYLGINSLANACCGFYIEHLNVGDCLDVLHVAQAFDQLELVNAVCEFISNKFDDVTNSETFLSISSDLLSKIIDFSIRKIEREKALAGIIAWVAHRIDERLEKLQQHMQYLNMDKKAIQKTFVRVCKAARDSGQSLERIECIRKVRNRILPDIEDTSKKRKVQPNQSRIIGIRHYFGTAANFQEFNIHTSEWSTHLRCPTNIDYNVSVSSLNGMMFCSGGTDDPHLLEEFSFVNAYNFDTREWRDDIGQLTIVSSSHHKLFCINDAMYAIDILDGHAFVEKYDPVLTRWNNVTSSTEPERENGFFLYNHNQYEIACVARWSFIVHENCIYIIFWNGQKTVSYDVQQQRFRDRSVTSCQFGNSPEFLSLNNHLYALDFVESKILRRYEAVSDTWERCSPMNYSCVYTSGSAVCLNSSIYVIGGGTINRQISTTEFPDVMEKYNSFTDQWTIIEHTNTMNAISREGKIHLKPMYSAVAFGGKLYIMRTIDDSEKCAGFEHVPRLNEFQILFSSYDPCENTWEQLRSPPTIDFNGKFKVDSVKLT